MPPLDGLKRMFKLACVLFDLDGTLVDTAPDLIACLNKSLIDHGFSAIEAEKVRACISQGAIAMIEKSETQADAQTQAQILETMLEYYQHNILQYGHFFEGIEETLNFIEEKGLKWGVITNKKARFTLPLIEALQLTERAACIISSDTTLHSKPHPEPMLTACKHAQVNAENCVYIGDAKHDIIAGKTVNMKTLAAVYGYLTFDDKPEDWGADALIESPEKIKTWIQTALCY